MTVHERWCDQPPESPIVAELAKTTTQPGPNPSSWPGLTSYRFTSPQPPQWDEIHSLAMCFVAQGRKALRTNGVEYHYDPFNYVILTRGMRYQAEILEASQARPFLSLVLQIDPGVVRRVTADLRAIAHQRHRASDPNGAVLDVRISPVNQHLTDAILRFLRALDNAGDQQVLAPLYLQEIVCRLLQAQQGHCLVASAANDLETDPVRAAIDFIHGNPNRQVTVYELAERAYMSTSTFAHRFREATGISPYQFVKNTRLEWARTALLEGHTSVAEAANRAGYANASHFITQFKRRYGVTPRRYADEQALAVPLQIRAARTLAGPDSD